MFEMLKKFTEMPLLKQTAETVSDAAMRLANNQELIYKQLLALTSDLQLLTHETMLLRDILLKNSQSLPMAHYEKAASLNESIQHENARAT